MNNPLNPSGDGGVSGSVLVVGVTVMFSVTTAAAVLLAIFAEESTTVIAVLFANLAAALPAVLALAKVSNTAVQVDKLANGLMDAKVRSGLADVLPDELIDDDAKPLLAADRARLEAQHQQRVDPADPLEIAQQRAQQRRE